MAKINKSAKDIAFDKERANFRSEIRNLKYQIQYRDKQIEELGETVRQREEELFKLNDWIERLLEYTEISKEDLKKLIESEREKAEVREKISTTLGILGMFGGNFR
jgi:peptidoglycan hydrolase CwlO-like protein